MRQVSAIVIGASAGATEALSVLLPALPAGFHAAVLVVVHVPPSKENLLPELFDRRCMLRVKEAEDKEPISPGQVYFGAPNYHLLVEPNRRLSLSSDEPVMYSRPSIDVLFESAADAYGEELLAVVLTGANADGARGARAIREKGGRVLVQAPSTAQAREMPEAAIRACPDATVLDLPGLAALLVGLQTR